MTKLIIFDLDGTLLDTLGDIASACNHALEMCGCPTHETEAYRQLVGRGISNLFKGALPEESRTEEMVEKTGFGWVCDNTVEAMTQALRNILDNPELLKEKEAFLHTCRHSNEEAIRQFCRLAEDNQND